MPFRVPSSYWSSQVCPRDPQPSELREYIDWLRAELAVAEAALDQTKPPEEK